MKYLVLECHQGYAIVLDNNGRFVKVANLNYEVGQTLERVIEMGDPAISNSGVKKRISKIIIAAAACLSLIIGGANYWLTPQGTVQMAINPEVMMVVNRLDYVVKLEGLNEDGVALVKNVSRFGKKVDTLADELADEAFELGFLSEGGQIALTVLGKNEQWEKSTEKRLKYELETHLGGKVIVVTDPIEQNNVQQDTAPPKDSQVVITVPKENTKNQVKNADSDYKDTDFLGLFYYQ